MVARRRGTDRKITGFSLSTADTHKPFQSCIQETFRRQPARQDLGVESAVRMGQSTRGGRERERAGEGGGGGGGTKPWQADTACLAAMASKVRAGPNRAGQ